MLFSTDKDAHEIQSFCVETLESNVDFQAFCISLVGEVLNYEIDTRIDDEEELPVYPYCIAYSGEEPQDMRVEEWGHTYEIGLVFGIKDTRASTVENNIKKYQDPIKAEKLAKEAVKTILAKMKSHGINNDYEITIVAAMGEKTPTGESDDLNYILSLTFGYLDDINKGC